MEIIKRLQKVAVAQMVGIVVLVIVAFVMNLKAAQPAFEAKEMAYIKMGYILIMLIGIPFVFSIPKKRISKLSQEASVQDKLELFQKNFFLKMGALELLSLLAVILFLITNQSSYLLVTGFLLVIITTIFPTKARASIELNIDEDEIK